MCGSLAVPLLSANPMHLSQASIQHSSVLIVLFIHLYNIFTYNLFTYFSIYRRLGDYGSFTWCCTYCSLNSCLLLQLCYLAFLCYLPKCNQIYHQCELRQAWGAYQWGWVWLLAGGVISLAHCVGPFTAGGGFTAASLPPTHLSPSGGSLPGPLTRLLQGTTKSHQYITQ